MENARQMDHDLEIQEKKNRLQELERLRDLVFAIDTDHSGSVSAQEIKEAWNDPDFSQLLHVCVTVVFRSKTRQ